MPELYEHDRVDQVPVLLIRLGAEDEAMHWARSLTEPSDRAGALLMSAHAFLVRSRTTTLMWVSNGPDSFREEF